MYQTTRQIALLSHRENPFRLQIGPIVIDPKTIGISLVSIVIVLPATLFISEIFRRSRVQRKNQVDFQSSFSTLQSATKKVNGN